ncbi:hypothetical protein J2S43_001111 [Catenuloplanes nepalensis]|uniref:Uncharacterized protein n=1 Tax=Catenuloplanes nepalensis TaxID=587533 RepID=A0ABT9MME6_9ACTN|nr:hypothetical protein [Catenuloplanes nepalensis]
MIDTHIGLLSGTAGCGAAIADRRAHQKIATLPVCIEPAA